MDICSICVNDHTVGGFANATVHPEFTTVKALPMLSVVQSVHGSYSIMLDGGEPASTGEGGVFVAPRQVIQTIREFPGTGGTMTAQWVFMDVEINKLYKLDDLYTFPLILPAAYNNELFELISRTCAESSLAARLPHLHRIIQILLENSEPSERVSDTAMRLKNYLENNYARDISADELCAFLSCSRSVMYHRFREMLGASPTQYINSIRIRHAQLMLANTKKTVAEIAAAVGIHDQFYFARLFRHLTGETAGEYRGRQQAL